MKSLFIVNDFPPILGGQSVYYHNLCRGLPPNQFIVLAPSIEGDQAIDAQETFSIIRKPYLIKVPILEKLVKIIFPFFYALPLIKEHDIKMIHAAHILSTGITALLLKKIKGIDYSVTSHSADILQHQKIPLIKKLLQVILKNAKVVLANSHFTQSKLIELGTQADKITVVYPRIDTTPFLRDIDPKSIVEQYNLKNKAILLSVNRLVERKGNDRVIESIKKVLEKIPDIHYIICGDGPNRKNLKRLIKEHKLENHVLMTGKTSFDDILRFYKICDVFIMASREIKEKGDTEGFGISFLEANVMGKPVIGGNSGGIPDAVLDQNTGLLVEPENIEDIAAKIIQLFSDTHLSQQLGSNGKNRVLNHFDWRKGFKELNFLFPPEQT